MTGECGWTADDPRKVEGVVNLACTACGKATLYDLEKPIRSRLFHRPSPDWGVILHERNRCPSADSRVGRDVDD